MPQTSNQPICTLVVPYSRIVALPRRNMQHNSSIPRLRSHQTLKTSLEETADPIAAVAQACAALRQRRHKA
jgi:hypothetical protein